MFWKQCNRLNEVANHVQEPLTSVSGTDPSDLERLATMLDETEAKVSAVPLTDERLVGFRDDYAKMARDLANTARATSAAMRSNDSAKLSAVAKKMNSFSERESELTDAMNRYCSGSP